MKYSLIATKIKQEFNSGWNLILLIILFLSVLFKTPVLSNSKMYPFVGGINIKATSCNSIEVSWAKLNPADFVNYGIFRADITNPDLPNEPYNSYVLVGSVSLNDLSFVDLNVEPNKSYSYSVSALNYTLGYTPRISYAKALTYCPSKLNTSINAYDINCSQIVVQWKDISNYNEESYELYRSAGSAEGPFVLIALPVANATQWIDGQLNSSTKYYYTIRARFSDSFSGYSPVSGAQTSGINLRLMSYCATKAVLDWDICTPNREKWIIKASTDNMNFYDLGETNALTNHFEAINLKPNTTYYFAVQPVYSNGFSNLSNVVSAHLPTFPSPSNFKATYAEDQITLTWADNSGGCDNEEQFIVMKKNETGEFFDYALIDPNQTTFIDINIAADQEYCYIVKSRYYYGFQYADGLCISTKTTALSAIVPNNFKKPTLKFSKSREAYQIESIEPDFGEQLFLYPNPVKNQLNLKLPVDLEGKSKIIITDLIGLVYSETLLSGLENNIEYKLDISQLKSGMYFLNIYNENLKKDWKAKFIKID
ncbi:MAG: T9SS type A sorting domain-containing protein [Bacteroidota bacterium]